MIKNENIKKNNIKKDKIYKKKSDINCKNNYDLEKDSVSKSASESESICNSDSISNSNSNSQYNSDSDSDSDSDSELESKSTNSSKLNNNEDKKIVYDKNDLEKNKKNLENIFTQKELCYYKMIDKFFNTCNLNDKKKMIDIINGESKLSLRILDFFVTKNSKKMSNCDIITKFSDVFDVRISYKSQLKSYKKRYFDPFRRRKKFDYYFMEDTHVQHIKTTLGQLNFFKWAITYDIISHVEINLKKISDDMVISNKENKKKKKKKIELLLKEKKKENTKNITKKSSVNIKEDNYEDFQIVLNFD
jgi:hypothetical protein